MSGEEVGQSFIARCAYFSEGPRSRACALQCRCTCHDTVGCHRQINQVLAAAAFASSAAATAGLTFLPSFQRTRGGGARLRRPSRERTRTTVGCVRYISKRVIGERTMGVNGAGDAVSNFDVQLGDRVFYYRRPISLRCGQKKRVRRTRVHGSIADITDGSALDHVADGEALDRLVLRDAARAVRAAHERYVATATLVTAAISSLLGLRGRISTVRWVSSRLPRRNPAEYGALVSSRASTTHRWAIQRVCKHGSAHHFGRKDKGLAGVDGRWPWDGSQIA